MIILLDVTGRNGSSSQTHKEKKHAFVNNNYNLKNLKRFKKNKYKKSKL